MIYAKNADALCYRGIHRNLDLALEHITPEFLSSLEDNVRVPLDGVKPGKYRIKVTVSRCDEPDLAPQGEILAEAFVPLIVPKASKQ